MIYDWKIGEAWMTWTRVIWNLMFNSTQILLVH